jgi:hypothetical protein
MTFFNLAVKAASSYEDCISYYPLDSDADDAKGSNNLTETDESYVTGKIGNCCEFNGTSTFLNTASDLVNTADFSLNFWVKIDTAADNDQLFRLDTSQTGFAMLTNENGGAYYAYLYYFSSGANGTYEGSTDLNDSNWHMITIVVDSSDTGDEIKVYVDGSIDAHGGLAGGRNSPQNFNRFGQNDGDRWFDGFLDEISIYNKPLSSNQITKLYNAGTGIAASEAKGNFNYIGGGFF